MIFENSGEIDSSSPTRSARDKSQQGVGAQGKLLDKRDAFDMTMRVPQLCQ